MHEIIDALYGLTEAGHDQSYWLFGEDAAAAYGDSVHLAERQYEKLRGRLDSTGCELLEKYGENRSLRSDYECRIAFARGLSIGLALAALAR